MPGAGFGAGNVTPIALAAGPLNVCPPRGVEVARNAAQTVKRVAQELGGKSPNIVLDDENFATNVSGAVATVMVNSGQTCSALTRMLVPRNRMDEAIEVARVAAADLPVGDPTGAVALGPVVSASQFERVQALIQQGIEEGATLTGGPDDLPPANYVKPTGFANVTKT